MWVSIQDAITMIKGSITAFGYGVKYDPEKCIADMEPLSVDGMVTMAFTVDVDGLFRIFVLDSMERFLWLQEEVGVCQQLMLFGLLCNKELRANVTAALPAHAVKSITSMVRAKMHSTVEAAVADRTAVMAVVDAGGDNDAVEKAIRALTSVGANSSHNDC